MIKIDHTAMYVHDLEAAKDFFVRFFKAHANKMYHNANTGLRTYFLTFEDGSRLELMNRPETSAAAQSAQHIGFTHIAFSVGGREKVNEVTQMLVDNGYKVLSEPRTTGDGYYESCVADAEGNQIEITE